MSVNTWLFQHALPKFNHTNNTVSTVRSIPKSQDVRKKRLRDKEELLLPPNKQQSSSSLSKLDSLESQDVDDKVYRNYCV